MINNDVSHSMREGFSELRTGLACIGFAGYEYGVTQVRRGWTHLSHKAAPAYNIIAPYVQRTVAVATPVLQRVRREARPFAAAAYNRGCYELQETVRGAVDVYHMSRSAFQVGIMKVDQFSDTILPRPLATVAKTAVRVFPAAVATTEMVVYGASHFVTGGLLLGASAALIGRENTGNGAGLGCITTGVLHLARGFVTRSIGSFVRGVAEVIYGARLLRGNGLIVSAPAASRSLNVSSET
jgi:hypothetical protein